MKHFDYRHVVLLEETNALGNVYFAHYLRWQGHCRELFLQRYAPDVVTELGSRYRLVTTRCSCDYLSELEAFDTVLVRMQVTEVAQHRLTLSFEYHRELVDRRELVARGEQQLAWLEVREGGRLVPRRVPEALLDAIDAYRELSAAGPVRAPG